MDKKMISGVVVTLVVAGALGFYGGMRYAQAKGISLKSLQNLSAQQRQQLLQQFRSGGGIFTGRNGGNGGRQQGNFVSGEVLSRDDKSITVKLPDGSSKIVFFSGSTNIGKTASGTPDDLAVGNQVTVSGNANSDGSISAQLIQIRPGLPRNQQ